MQRLTQTFVLCVATLFALAGFARGDGYLTYVGDEKIPLVVVRGTPY
jgi:hypothetical protein